MVDTLSREERSARMRAIQPHGTKPELVVRRQAAAALHMTPAKLRELLAGRFRAYSVDDLERLASSIEK